MKRQEWNSFEPNIGTGARPRLWETDANWFILAIFKHSTILEKKFSVNNLLSPNCTADFGHIYTEIPCKLHLTSFTMIGTDDSDSAQGRAWGDWLR